MDGVRFLEARPLGGRSPAVLIHGAPWDGSVSWRAGASAGPSAIRIASESIESYSPRLRRDLRDVDVADAGDVDLTGLKAEDAIARIADATARAARSGAPVLTLGGDHSVSIGTSRGLRAMHPDLAHVVYDAHLDLREGYDGTDLSHACGTRHMALAGPTCVLGVRSGSREEFADAERLLAAWSADVSVPPSVRVAAESRPVLISVDLDVLDPATFPGTGNPEPGGPAYGAVLDSLLSLGGARVVGLDVTECAPPLDPSGLSAIVAAELARECILGLLAAR